MYVIENNETKTGDKEIYVHINMQEVFDVCCLFDDHLMLKTNEKITRIMSFK